MSEKKKSFVQRCADGEASPEDIDDAVDDWHNSDGAPALHTYLGMREEEYAAWLRDAGAITGIVHARRTGRA